MQNFESGGVEAGPGQTRRAQAGNGRFTWDRASSLLTDGTRAAYRLRSSSRGVSPAAWRKLSRGASGKHPGGMEAAMSASTCPAKGHLVLALPPRPPAERFFLLS